MTYEKPEVRDFGSIADHTYWGGWFGGFCGGSGKPAYTGGFRGES